MKWSEVLIHSLVGKYLYFVTSQLWYFSNNSWHLFVLSLHIGYKITKFLHTGTTIILSQKSCVKVGLSLVVILSKLCILRSIPVEGLAPWTIIKWIPLDKKLGRSCFQGICETLSKMLGQNVDILMRDLRLKHVWNHSNLIGQQQTRDRWRHIRKDTWTKCHQLLNSWSKSLSGMSIIVLHF